ncbi:MAG: tetratricopeptide repeat protein [Rhizomicrobium sp.]
MRRLALQIAGLALGTALLGGCGMMGGDSTAAAPASTHSSDDAAPIPLDMAAAVRQAQMLRTKGDLDGATRVLSQLMLMQPDDPRVVGEYGKLLVQKGQTADAVQFLQRAIQLQPNDWTLYSALGVAYDKQSDPANAKLAYEHALAMKPGEGAVLNNYAMSRMLAGDTVGARTLLMQAQASGASDPKIAANIALLDRMAPSLAGAPTASGFATAAPRSPVVASTLLSPPAQGAPRALGRSGGADVVMQAVPFDPKAGPVGREARTVKGKPAKLAKAGHPAKRLAADGATPKPAKAAKTSAPVKDHIPALRMTADASKP